MVPNCRTWPGSKQSTTNNLSASLIFLTLAISSLPSSMPPGPAAQPASKRMPIICIDELLFITFINSKGFIGKPENELPSGEKSKTARNAAQPFRDRAGISIMKHNGQIFVGLVVNLQLAVEPFPIDIGMVAFSIE